MKLPRSGLITAFALAMAPLVAQGAPVTIDYTATSATVGGTPGFPHTFSLSDGGATLLLQMVSVTPVEPSTWGRVKATFR